MAFWISKIIAIIYIALNTVIIAPYCAYQAYIFNKRKTTDAFLFHRKPNMVIQFNIVCLCTLVIISPISYSILIFSRPNSDTKIKEHLSYMVVLLAIMLTFSLAFWRAWHMWYDTRHKTEEAIHSWAKHLNENTQSFAKYKNTFGNQRWTSKWGTIILSIFSTIALFVLSIVFLETFLKTV